MIHQEVAPQREAARSLARTLSAITALVEGVGADEARIRHDADHWSLVEIVGHLLDEEREDFRARIELIFDDPCAPWPAIDPQGWVEERAHRSRSVQELLRLFQDERQRSLSWLGALDDPDWHVEKDHPLGALRAGDLLLAWVAHDLAHLSQMARWHADAASARLQPFQDDYAY
ncbi:MAG: DinB family protein [Planctomycetota bacterium]|nr:DinB family protein [Planctomycetota bacterium]